MSSALPSLCPMALGYVEPGVHEGTSFFQVKNSHQGHGLRMLQAIVLWPGTRTDQEGDIYRAQG